MKTIRTKPRERAKESNHKHIKWSKRTKAKKKSNQEIYMHIYFKVIKTTLTFEQNETNKKV